MGWRVAAILRLWTSKTTWPKQTGFKQLTFHWHEQGSHIAARILMTIAPSPQWLQNLLLMNEGIRPSIMWSTWPTISCFGHSKLPLTLDTALKKWCPCAWKRRAGESGDLGRKRVGNGLIDCSLLTKRYGRGGWSLRKVVSISGCLQPNPARTWSQPAALNHLLGDKRDLNGNEKRRCRSSMIAELAGATRASLADQFWCEVSSILHGTEPTRVEDFRRLGFGLSGNAESYVGYHYRSRISLKKLLNLWIYDSTITFHDGTAGGDSDSSKSPFELPWRRAGFDWNHYL